MSAKDPFDGIEIDPTSAKVEDGEWKPVGITIEDFIATVAPLHWAIGGMAVTGGIVVFQGDPESFKSTAAHNIAMAYTGRWASPWMGFDIGSGPVIYATNDKSASSVRERFVKMHTTATTAAFPIYVAHSKVRVGMPAEDKRKRDWEDLLDDVRHLVADGQKPLVILDTLASMGWPGFNENDTEDMNRYIDALHRLTDEGATVLLVHHKSKASNGSSNPMAMRGSSALYGAIDGTVDFAKDKDNALRGTMVAQPKDGEKRVITFSVDPDTDFRMVDGVFRITLLTIQMVVDAVANGATSKNAVWDALKGNPPQPTKDEVNSKITDAITNGAILRDDTRNRRLTINPAYAPADDDDSGERQRPDGVVSDDPMDDDDD